MNSPDLVVEQVATLLGGPVDPDLGDGLRVVVVATADRFEQPGGEPCAQRQLGHPCQVFPRGNGHDSRDDRHPDTGQLATLAEIVEVGVTEEELSTDVVGPGIDFAFEIIQLLEPVGSTRVSLGEAGDPDSEPSRLVGQRARADEPNELLGVLKRVEGTVVARHRCRRIAPKREDVFDFGFRVPIEDGGQLVLSVTDACQMGDRREPGLTLNPHDQVVGPLTRRPPRAIRHGDKRGLQSLEIGDRLEQFVRGLVGLRGKELKTESRRTGFENVLNVHDCHRARGDQGAAPGRSVFRIENNRLATEAGGPSS